MKKKAGNVLWRVGAAVLVCAAVLCVAGIWRMALQKGNSPENAEVLETAEEGVIYRYSENKEGAYVFIRNPDSGEDYADAFYLDPEEGTVYDENGEPITEAELGTGDRVRVFSNGMVLETYPQNYEEVFRVEVIKKADETEKEMYARKYQDTLAWLYGEPDPSEPPSLQISYTQGETASAMTATRGGYQWSWESEDGQTQTAVADTSFITEWPYLVEADLSLADSPIEILPGKEGFDEITVTCWSEEVKTMLEMPEGESVKVENRDGRWYFTERKDGYYYLIHVRWGNDYVEYGFLSKLPEDSSAGGGEDSSEEASGTGSGKDFSGENSGAGLLAGASPQTSVLQLYYYDGEQVTVRTLSRKGKEQELLDGLNSLNAEEVSADRLAEWEVPCYGLWIGGKDGYDLCVAYANGLWLNQDGKLYAVEADFETLWKQLEGRDEENDRNVLSFPNAGILGKKDVRFLLPVDAEAVESPEGVSMAVTEYRDGIATVSIDNQSGDGIEYGEAYGLQKEIEGRWYELPMAVTNVGFADIAMVLNDQGQAEETCDLTIFGELGEGNYRLIKDDMAAEFFLDGEGNLEKGQ